MSRILASIALVALWIPPGVCSGRSPKLSPDVDSLPETAAAEFVDVIVQYGAPPSEQLRARIANRGGRLKAELHVIDAGLYSMPAAAVAALADDPGIRYVSPDREVRPALDVANTAAGAAIAFSSGWTGAGVGIAIIDSGILEVRDLLAPNSSAANGSRVVYSQSFVPGVTSATDQYGHGTHVAGIAAGNANASTGTTYSKFFRGVASAASLINLRVLDAKGSGTDSAVIQAIGRAVQLKNQYNIRVINLSLGRPVFESYRTDPLCKAVESAWRAGIVVVVAAGNSGRNRAADGYATINSPANDPLVITVGAMKTGGTESRADDAIASYSSKGPTPADHVVKPDLVAPGNRVISLVASKSLVANNSSVNRILYSYYQKTSSKSYSADYYRLSGTSMAAPLVSATAALMLHKDWTLSPDTIKARLMRSATKTFPLMSIATDPVTGAPFISQYDIFTIGAGYLDVNGALHDTSFVDPGSTAASPTAALNGDTGQVVVVNTDTSVWGKAAMWGTSADWSAGTVWGSTVFLGGTAAMWGSSSLWGSAAMWGTSLTSAGQLIWADSISTKPSPMVAGEALSQLINGEK